MIIRNVLLFSIFLLLLANFSSSLEADFIAYTDNIEACACSAAGQKIYFNNTGRISALFSLSQKGDASSWSLLAPENFELLPQKSAVVSEFLAIPCSASGNYGLVTDIRTDLGLSRQLVQNVKVSKCNNIKAALKKHPSEMCRCSTFTYLINVRNPSEFSDVYSFSLDRNSEFAVFTPPRVNIPPKHDADVELHLTPPCGVKEGGSFSIIVNAENNNLMQKIPVFFDVNGSCYAYRQKQQAGNETKSKIALAAYGKNLLLLLLIMPFVFVVILLFFAARKVAKRKSEEIKKPVIKSEKRYRWEKLFRREKRDEIREKKPVNLRKALLILIIIAALISMVLLSSYTIMKAAPGNFSVALNFTKPVIKLPEIKDNASAANESLPVIAVPVEKTGQKANISAPSFNFGKRTEEARAFAMNYKYYIALALFLLLLLAAMLYFRNFSVVNLFKKIPGSAIIIAVIIIVILGTAFLIYQNREQLFRKAINESEENGDDELVQENAAPENIAEERQQARMNMTAITSSFSIIFPKELFFSYFPYVMAGFVILAIVIFFITRMEKRNMEFPKKGKRAKAARK